MNVLVTGGSGLFGRKIIIHLARDKDVGRVISMDVNPPPDWFYKALLNHADKFNFVRGNVAELEDILNVVKMFAIDRIVNMAAILTGAFEVRPRLAIKTNALGVCNIFEAARLTGISRVVYASSVAVYGAAKEYGNKPVNEDDHLHPGDAYGLTKQLTEILAERYKALYGINSTGLRPFLGYGHGGAFPPVIKLFSDLVSLPAIGQPFITEMDGNAPSALSFADDVATLTCILIKTSSSPHPIYNIASQPTTLQQIASAVKKYLPEANIKFGTQATSPKTLKTGLPSKADMTRAGEDFGFTIMPLEKAVLIQINDARLAAGLAPISHGV